MLFPCSGNPTKGNLPGHVYSVVIRNPHSYLAREYTDKWLTLGQASEKYGDGIRVLTTHTICEKCK